MAVYVRQAVMVCIHSAYNISGSRAPPGSLLASTIPHITLPTLEVSNKGLGSDHQGNTTCNEPAAAMVRQIIEPYVDLKSAYDRLLADNGTVRDSVNVVSIDSRKLK